MSLTRNQYEKYTESFLKPVATISIGTIIVVWCSQWLPHVPNPTPVETFIVAVSFLCYFVLLFAGKNYQQVRLFTITTLGAANAVVLFNPGNPHSATIAYLVLEISVIGAVQLYQRWWTASVVAVWVAWLVELWRADVESLYPQITTSIPLAVATALSLYLNRRLRTRAVSDALTHQRAVDESRTDALTGLLNRRGFRAEVENRKTVAATFIDVNGQKKINDTYGHEAGDTAILSVSHAILENTRPDDVVCRWGGDEFVIVTVSTPPPNATLFAERINTWLAENTHEVFPIAVSAGQATLTEQQTVAELVETADENMYRLRAEKRAPGQAENPSSR